MNVKLLLKFTLDEIATLSNVPSAVSKSSNGGANGALVKFVCPDVTAIVCVCVWVVVAAVTVLGRLATLLMTLKSEIGSSDSSRGRIFISPRCRTRF
jgi:hypothetical protein